MPDKSFDEIAAEMTVAILEHNSKLIKGNGISTSSFVNANHVAKDFYILREVVAGNLNPFEQKNKKSD